MRSKLTLSLARSFFALVSVVSIGVCFTEGSSDSSSYQTIQNDVHNDGKGYYQTIDTVHKTSEAYIITFGILGGASILALGATFMGKQD